MKDVNLFQKNLSQQIHDDRLSQQKETLRELNDEIRDLDRLNTQRGLDGQMNKTLHSRRTQLNSARPRTPVEESHNPFEKLRAEEELAKYKRYLKFELPDIVTKQVNDIFEREESGLKSLMNERDQLLRMQLHSFHDYLSIMDQSRVRELNDMNNLKLEIDGLKRANDTRINSVNRALNQTEQMLADEMEWKRISKSYPANDFLRTSDRVKPYMLDQDSAWTEDRYLRGPTNRVDIRQNLQFEDSSNQVARSSLLGLPGAREIESDIKEEDIARKVRIGNIIHELDHLMDEMNNPKSYYTPK